jgi:multidrug efflux system membrane fusion protein
MSSSFRFHRVAAVAVLIAAGVWVGTGKFAAVGSEEAHAAQKPVEGSPAAAEAGGAPVHTVGVMVPQFLDHAREIRVSAATEADKTAVLAARANGIILKLPVKKGDRVRADDIVMELEGLDTAASVMTAEAALEQATRELAVQQELYARGNAPELQLIRARAAEAAAKAQVSQSKAALDRLYLRAPFSGVVDKVDVEIGEWVQAGAPVANVMSTDPVVVRAEIGEVDMGDIKVGDKADVRLVNGASLAGTIRDIARTANTDTRTFGVEIVVGNPGGEIPVGMTGEVSLFAKPVRAAAIPRSVITLSSAGVIGVRVVDKADVTSFVPVTILDDTSEGLMVAGIPAGVRVVVLGQDLVRDGEKVDVKEIKAGDVLAGTAP